jgi:haloalkane dehalogenase
MVKTPLRREPEARAVGQGSDPVKSDGIGILSHSPLLYPFASNFLDLGAARMHYVDEGRGEPVLMLHGNPTWSFYFRGLIQALRGGWRCVAPDHVGCGLSDKPDDLRYEYTLERRVRDVEALVERLGIGDRLTLVLHDWGGMIGMAFAHRNPEKVKRLVVLNTAAFLLPSGKRLPWSLRLCRTPRLGAWLVRGLNLFCRGAVRCCTRRPLPREVRAAYLAPYDSWNNRIAVHRFVQDIPLRLGDPSYALVREVQDGLPQFRGLPMLIGWGERDFVFDSEFLDGWRRRFPEAEVHAFTDAGHFVLEDAGEQLIPRIRAFLESWPVRG